MMKKTLAIIMFFTLGVATGVIGTYWAISQQDSPYLRKTERLSDVIAALTVMGTWKFDKLEPEEWQ